MVNKLAKIIAKQFIEIVERIARECHFKFDKSRLKIKAKHCKSILEVFYKKHHEHCGCHDKDEWGQPVVTINYEGIEYRDLTNKKWIEYLEKVALLFLRKINKHHQHEKCHKHPHHPCDCNKHHDKSESDKSESEKSETDKSESDKSDKSESDKSESETETESEQSESETSESEKSETEIQKPWKSEDRCDKCHHKHEQCKCHKHHDKCDRCNKCRHDCKCHHHNNCYHVDECKRARIYEGYIRNSRLHPNCCFFVDDDLI